MAKKEQAPKQPITARKVSKRRFAEEWVKDRNNTQAAIRCGYSKKTAYAQGNRLLKDAEVQSIICELLEDLRLSCDLDAKMVIEELRSLGFWNIQDYIGEANTIKDISKLPRAKTRSIVGIKRTERTYDDGSTVVTTELKMVDKRGALVDLGRHLGIFEADNLQAKEVIHVGYGKEE